MHARKGHPANARAPGPRITGSRKKKGKGGDGGRGPSQPAVPHVLRGLRAAAAVAPAARKAPAPLRLLFPQGVPPNARQQWAEAYTVVGRRVLNACANAQGVGARADVVQAEQEFGALARTVFVCSRSRRSGAAAAAITARLADGLPLEVAGRKEDSERIAGLRRPHLSDAQRQAALIERCLHQKRSVHGVARALHDSKHADARDPGVRPSLHAAHPVAAPAAPLEAAQLALQLIREHLEEVVSICEQIAVYDLCDSVDLLPALAVPGLCSLLHLTQQR